MMHRTTAAQATTHHARAANAWSANNLAGENTRTRVGDCGRRPLLTLVSRKAPGLSRISATEETMFEFSLKYLGVLRHLTEAAVGAAGPPMRSPVGQASSHRVGKRDHRHHRSCWHH